MYRKHFRVMPVARLHVMTCMAVVELKLLVLHANAVKLDISKYYSKTRLQRNRKEQKFNSLQEGTVCYR
jgi:hypothetical protein